LAHRPFPSMTIATCLGTSSDGIVGGRTPVECGGGSGQLGLLGIRQP